MHKRLMTTLAAILATTMFAACANTITEAESPFSMTTADGQPAVLLVMDREDWPHDAYEFLSMKLVGDILDVSVRYGGGCRTHEFALLVTPVFLESYPVQMRGSLAHNANGDPCRALIGHALRLDLTPLRRLYAESYGRSSDTIMLHIEGWPDPVRYSF